MEDTEYELVSHDEVGRLKGEIERLKSNPFIQNSSEERLYDAISHLNDSVGRLYTLFESINKQLMKEYQNGNSPEEKIDKLLDQNKSIAEALVSFGSKLDSMQENQTPVSQNQMQYSAPQTLQVPIQQQMNSISQTANLQRPVSKNSYSDDDMMPPMPNTSQNQFSQTPANVQMQSAASQQPQMQRPQMNSVQQPAPSFAPIFPQGQNYGQPQMNPQTNSQANSQMNQRQSFDDGLDINYPVPDRFQSLNTAPSIGNPIDLRPEPPKKSGLFSGLLKK
jgi:hypothetical protein